MVSFSDSKMTVCHICGDKGEAQCLINCVKCQDFLVHKYCCGNVSPDGDKVTWMCEECAPRVAKVGPSRKSQRISSKKVRDVEVRLNWMNMLNKKISTEKKQDRMEAGMFKVEHSFNQTTIEDYEKPRDSRIKDGHLSQGQVESVPYGSSVPFKRCTSPSSEFSNHICAQPIKDPIWRGQFNIATAKDEIAVEIMAHLSSKACPKVINAASAFPSVIEFEVLGKLDAWPKSFQRSPPTDDSIALYLFPVSERDEKVFDGILDFLNEDNLALKAEMDDVKLVIFSSLELPKQHWRFQRKYYLWGVLIQKQYL